jgi:nitrogen-specific signal transduction histidine kinase
LNLINNAFYAVQVKTHGGASLQQTPSPHKPTVTVSTQKNSHGIEITVKDNGPGIPDTIKDKIFQPFFTTKPTGQGTGLGLSLAYDIVKAHGGEIFDDSSWQSFSDPNLYNKAIQKKVKKTNIIWYRKRISIDSTITQNLVAYVSQSGASEIISTGNFSIPLVMSAATGIL